MAETLYPLDASLKEDLPSVLTPMVVMNLIRSISRMLDISHPQVEILLTLLASGGTLSGTDLRATMTHFSKDQITNLLMNLIKDQLIVKKGTKYTILPVARRVIKSVDRSQVNPNSTS